MKILLKSLSYLRMTMEKEAVCLLVQEHPSKLYKVVVVVVCTCKELVSL